MQNSTIMAKGLFHDYDLSLILLINFLYLLTVKPRKSLVTTAGSFVTTAGSLVTRHYRNLVWSNLPQSQQITSCPNGWPHKKNIIA